MNLAKLDSSGRSGAKLVLGAWLVPGCLKFARRVQGQLPSLRLGGDAALRFSSATRGLRHSGRRRHAGDTGPYALVHASIGSMLLYRLYDK